MVDISLREQEKLNKDFQSQEVPSITSRAWPFTGERKYWYYRTWLVTTLLMLPFLISLTGFEWTKQGALHMAFLVALVIFGAASVIYILYNLKHGRTESQLRVKEYQSAKQSSVQNKAELLGFADELKNKKDSDE